MNKKLLLNYLAANSNVLEAGAHIGTDTVELSQLFHEGRVYALEPIKHLFAQLQQNVAHCPNVSIYNLALDDETSIKEMFVSTGGSDASSSLLKPKEHLTLCPTVFFKEKETVNTITINDWADYFQIERIDFMWLDLQGNEYKVLRKADKLLISVKVIYSEVSQVELYEGLCLYEDYKNYLTNLGFREELKVVSDSSVLFVKQ